MRAPDLPHDQVAEPPRRARPRCAGPARPARSRARSRPATSSDAAQASERERLPRQPDVVWSPVQPEVPRPAPERADGRRPPRPGSSAPSRPVSSTRQLGPQYGAAAAAATAAGSSSRRCSTRRPTKDAPTRNPNRARIRGQEVQQRRDLARGSRTRPAGSHWPDVAPGRRDVAVAGTGRSSSARPGPAQSRRALLEVARCSWYCCCGLGTSAARAGASRPSWLPR